MLENYQKQIQDLTLQMTKFDGLLLEKEKEKQMLVVQLEEKVG